MEHLSQPSHVVQIYYVDEMMLASSLEDIDSGHKFM